ncbi:MAG: HAD family phosphatase [Candidatus Cloacimonadales bacterium]
MIEAIIFDMDGVLIDSEPIYFEVEQALFQKLGLDISFQQHNKFVGMTMPAIWKKIKAEYELDYTIEQLVEMHKKGIYQRFVAAADLLPNPGLATLLEYLKQHNYRLAVASSTNRELVKIILKKLQLLQWFESFSGGDEVVAGKPEPDVFLLAAQKLEISTEKCLVFEDSENGVLAAKAAGMQVIGYQNSGSGQQNLAAAEAIISNFHNLEKIKKILR